MTLTLRIQNLDATRTATVAEETFSFDTPASHTEQSTLGPGESRSYTIHAAKRLRITEDPNAEQPK